MSERRFDTSQSPGPNGDTPSDVAILTATGNREPSPPLLAHLPTLAGRVAMLPDNITTIIMLDDPLPDAATTHLIERMLDAFTGSACDAMAQSSPVSEAMKRVSGGLVVDGVDRSSLVTIRPPEILDRIALSEAILLTKAEGWVNPTTLVADNGGLVEFFGLRQTI